MPEARSQIVLVSVVFFSAALLLASIGPLLPDLARQTGVSVAAVGSVYTAMYTCALLAQSATAFLWKRAGPHKLMFGGIIAFLVGTSGMAISDSLTLLLAMASCAGLGFGCLLLLGNALAAEASADAGPLNFINGMFGVGAILSPALVSGALVVTGSGLYAFWIIPLAMSVALVLNSNRWRRESSTRSDNTTPVAAGQGHELATLVKSPAIWMLAVFVLSDISIETAIAAWLPTIFERSSFMTPAGGALLMSWYWFLLTVSRFSVARASQTISAHVVLSIAVLFCAVGALLLFMGTMTSSRTLAMIGVTTTAFAIGPVLPTALSLVRNRFPQCPGVATGFVFWISNTGAAVVPLAMGIHMADHGVNAGTAAILVLTVVMGLLYVLARRHARNARVLVP